jgi:hypothetical protein
VRCGVSGSWSDGIRDVIEPPRPDNAIAFVRCDPYNPRSIDAASYAAPVLEDTDTLTVGVALGACGAWFTETVILMHIRAEEAADVLRPLFGGPGSRALHPLDIPELRWLIKQAGEVIAERHPGPSSGTGQKVAIDESVARVRSRGALTDDSGWCNIILRYGPAFDLRVLDGTLGGGEDGVAERPAVFGTFLDPRYGRNDELVMFARLSWLVAGHLTEDRCTRASVTSGQRPTQQTNPLRPRATRPARFRHQE